MSDKNKLDKRNEIATKRNHDCRPAVKEWDPESLSTQADAVKTVEIAGQRMVRLRANSPRVEDVHAMVKVLKKEGFHVLEQTAESETGKIAGVIDPEGNKVEPWQPSSQANQNSGDSRARMAAFLTEHILCS